MSGILYVSEVNLQKLFFAFVISKHDGQTIQSTVMKTRYHVPPPKHAKKRKASSDQTIAQNMSKTSGILRFVFFPEFMKKDQSICANKYKNMFTASGQPPYITSGMAHKRGEVISAYYLCLCCWVKRIIRICGLTFLNLLNQLQRIDKT